MQSFFQKRRSSRDSGAARQSAFFAKLSFSRKKAERGGTLRFPPLKLPSLKSLPVTVAGHWVLPSEVCAVYSVGRPPDRLCRSSNGCALRLAWAVFPRRNRLLLVLRSSSQLLLRRLCSHGFARKVHSHADCALAPSRCSHPCVERSTEGINQYREQSQKKNPTGVTPLSFLCLLSFCKRK